MDGDRELLSGEVGRADRGPPANVPEANRVRGRAEVEGAPVEDPVDRPHQRATVLGGGGEREQAHPLEPRGKLTGGDSTLRRGDAPQMIACIPIAPVEQGLERPQVLVSLVHRCTPAAAFTRATPMASSP